MQPREDGLITIGQLQIRYLMDGTVEGAASGMFELVYRRAPRSPPHSHADNEEIMYCLEGTLRSTVGGEVRNLKPGERAFTPRGVPHGFSNPHDKVARALVVLTPDIGAQYFRDVAAEALRFDAGTTAACGLTPPYTATGCHSEPIHKLRSGNPRDSSLLLWTPLLGRRKNRGTEGHNETVETVRKTPSHCLIVSL